MLVSMKTDTLPVTEQLRLQLTSPDNGSGEVVKVEVFREDGQPLDFQEMKKTIRILEAVVMLHQLADLVGEDTLKKAAEEEEARRLKDKPNA